MIRIGISGWSYDGWRGTFYPRGLPADQRLRFASRRFASIEVNGSFYSLQKPDSYEAWRRDSPAGFRFAVKGSRFITHNRKLGDVETELANFFASGILRLGEKLGPVLWQLSPALRFDEERVAAFLDLLPHDFGEAAALGKKHDSRLENRSWTAVPRDRRSRRVRHAFEPRHESFFVPDFARLCRDRGVAIVFSESADWPWTEEVTAGFVYIRLHGSRETYVSGYDDAALDRWAKRIDAWAHGRQPPDADRFTDMQPPPRKGRDVYVYFDNDAKVKAPGDAARLAEMLGVGPQADRRGGE